MTCPARRNNSDCARAAARPDFERESREDARTNGAALTVFVAYEKLPTPYEGGHVRTRQLLSWLCAAGHRVLLAHRDVKKRVAKFDPEPAAVVKDLNIAHCDDGNFAVFALDETMEGVSAHKLARQRVDIVVATTWFYRLSAPPIPALVIPLATQLGDIRRRKIPVVLTSDDVQHERARAVGAAISRPVVRKASVRGSEEPSKRRACRSLGSPPRPRSPAARPALTGGCSPAAARFCDFNLRSTWICTVNLNFNLTYTDGARCAAFRARLGIETDAW